MPRTPCAECPLGFTKVELLTVLAIVSLALTAAAPAMSDIASGLTLQSACLHVATVFNEARGRAIFKRRDVGVRWISSGGDLTLAIYEDGNGNGVLSSDIRTGDDRLVAGPISMRKRFPLVSFSIVSRVTVDPNGTPIGSREDPIRFGRSDICTFSPLGHASPGSVYVSNGKRQGLVRVSPSNAKIQIFEWEPTGRRWQKRVS